MDVIFLDTETTGFGNCRLVELAYRKRGYKVGHAARVKPPIAIEEGAAQIHGITNEMCKDWPLFANLPQYQEIKETLERAVIVAHNAKFDIGVLEREGIICPMHIDTQKVAKMLYPHAPNHKLQGLRSYLQLDAEGDAHSAEGDVAVLAALFENMVATMEMRGTDPEDVLGAMMRATIH